MGFSGTHSAIYNCSALLVLRSRKGWWPTLSYSVRAGESLERMALSKAAHAPIETLENPALKPQLAGGTVLFKASALSWSLDKFA